MNTKWQKLSVEQIPRPMNLRMVVILVSGLFCSACPIKPETPSIAIEPECVIHANIGLTGPGRIAINGRAFASFRAGADTQFSPFLVTSDPVGDSFTGLPDSYAMHESWQRQPLGARVYRGQVVPATRITSSANDFNNRRWFVNVQDAKLGWRGPIKSSSNVIDNTSPLKIDGTGTDLNEEHMTPQFMPVGQATPEMFFCAGERTADDVSQTTWLFKATPPDASGSGGNEFIQDILNGDTILRQNSTITGDPLPGTLPPPQPSIGAPGAPVSSGHVSCAMIQSGDNITTRTLHVLAVNNGELLHSVLSDFGEATDNGSTLNRFRAVTPWAKVQPQWGVDLGVINNIAVVPKGNALQVFAVAKKAGVWRMWHTVRFNSGQWTAPKDVWKESGNAFNGSVYPFTVSADVCPAPGATHWDDAHTEIVLALTGGSSAREVLSMRVVQQPQLWVNGVFPSVYSPWSVIDPGAMTQTPPSSFFVRSASVAARPFRSIATP